MGELMEQEELFHSCSEIEDQFYIIYVYHIWCG